MNNIQMARKKKFEERKKIILELARKASNNQGIVTAKEIFNYADNDLRKRKWFCRGNIGKMLKVIKEAEPVRHSYKYGWKYRIITDVNII